MDGGVEAVLTRSIHASFVCVSDGIGDQLSGEGYHDSGGTSTLQSTRVTRSWPWHVCWCSVVGKAKVREGEASTARYLLTSRYGKVPKVRVPLL